MFSKYTVYYANAEYFVSLDGHPVFTYSVRSKRNPHKVIASYSDYSDPNAADKAIDDADERDELAADDE